MRRREAVLRRLLQARRAQDDLLEYVRLTMPDPRDPAHHPRSRYQTGRHHQLLAEHLHALEAGRITRLIVNAPPRHGKSELASKRFLAWLSGRNPDKSYIFGTYNETYAGDIGRAVRENIKAPEHRLVFPDHALKEGSASSQRLETTAGGALMFVGRGGTITGRGGHGIVIDDPIKDRNEADSRLIREQLWTWFTQVIATRLMTADSFILLIQTRWHEDDLVGRLTDPTNPCHDEEEASLWKVINLPAFAYGDGVEDILGRQPGEPLWPERFPAAFLEAQRRRDARGFQALYQGRPAADGGNFFSVEHIRTYKPSELPTQLRYYAASDHAVSMSQGRDKTCLLPIGVDEFDNIYVLPDVIWRQIPTDEAVEAMLTIMRRRRPLMWWAERGQISRAIGPFLRKRMAEEQTFCSILELAPTTDKQTRAQSIQARMAMGKVLFPEFAPWWPDAREQLLRFPRATFDDFVDALSLVGLGLAMQVSAGPKREDRSFGRPGTFRFLINQTRAAERRARAERDSAGW